MKFLELMIEMTEYTNENEIVIHSLGRSGSHAIMNWIASMFKEPAYVFNNCNLGDPFKARVRYYRRVKKRPIKKFFVRLPIRLRRLAETELNKYRRTHKDCLMYSYEHKDIRKLKNGDYMQNRGLLVGKSKNRYNILILRDFFNWLASFLLDKSLGDQPLSFFPEYNISGRDDWVQHAAIIPGSNYHRIKKRKNFELWKIYAGEFLGKTNYLTTKKICISFNQWFVDEDYRKKVASLLDLEYSDFTLDYIGSPSSFDETRYEGRAQELKVLDRWKILKDNIVYHEFLEPEAVKLSYEIFGEEIGNGLFYYG